MTHFFCKDGQGDNCCIRNSLDLLCFRRHSGEPQKRTKSLASPLQLFFRAQFRGAYGFIKKKIAENSRIDRAATVPDSTIQLKLLLLTIQSFESKVQKTQKTTLNRHTHNIEHILCQSDCE